MTRLRDKLLAVFLLATLVPLGLSFYAGSRLLDQSLDAAPVRELEQSLRSLESTGKAVYRQGQDLLRSQLDAGKLQPIPFPQAGLAAGESERFLLEGEDLILLKPEGAYRMPLQGIRLQQLQADLAAAREVVEAHRSRDLKRGFFLTLAVVSFTIWCLALAGLLWMTKRTTAPLEKLTRALRDFGEGRQPRLKVEGRDEVAQAVASFNEMTTQLEQGRERMLYVTRLESWQSLARKMAHEVKNSLTPIRLTVEEMVARAHPDDRKFLDEAGQIVTEEVQSLERRVRAFTELASDVPLEMQVLDLRSIVEERVRFLRRAHGDLRYELELDPETATVEADADLLRGVLTNLLENAADAAGPEGVIKLTLLASPDLVEVTVEDSGPGLSALARETLFQPTISFKPRGMGLGLSIAKRSAVAMGGALELVQGKLGGAAFRLRLKRGEKLCPKESLSLTTKKTLAAPSV